MQSIYRWKKLKDFLKVPPQHTGIPSQRQPLLFSYFCACFTLLLSELIGPDFDCILSLFIEGSLNLERKYIFMLLEQEVISLHFTEWDS